MKECPIYGVTTGEGNMPSFVVPDPETNEIVKPFSLSELLGGDTTIAPHERCEEHDDEFNHSYLRIENEEDFSDEALVIGPNVQKQYSRETLTPPVLQTEPDTTHIPFDNVVDINSEEIEKVKSDAADATKDMMGLLFHQHTPLALAAEVANAQIEAIFRDCFGVEIDPSLDFENQLDFVTSLDTFCYLLDKQKNIPNANRRNIIDRVTEKLILDWSRDTEKSIKAEGFRKYRNELENASARVKTEDGKEGSNIAVRGSRSRG